MEGNRRVTLAHGGGGKLTKEIEELFRSFLQNPILGAKGDSAILPEMGNGKIAMTTDTFVVNPLFFPGGDIGRIAVSGTVNDLTAAGATPVYMTVAVVLEEGLDFAILEKAIRSLADTAREAGVLVVAGDTKVVEKGHGGRIYINTTGLGLIKEGISVSPESARPGDAVIISGSIGEHGVAVLQERENMPFVTRCRSDVAPLNKMLEPVLASYQNLHVLRDPTRGGVAATLNEIAQQSKVGITLFENRIPVSPVVQGACDLLGLDPLEVANEGKMLLICPAEEAEAVVKTLQQHPYGKNAVVIGKVTSENPGQVAIQTLLGGMRVVEMPVGELLPRIC